jgi:HPt (histidine-containing phosphotransfer) domain-containing protein
MEITWNTSLIDPKGLIQIARGNNQRIQKYLNQFLELIPQRIEGLKIAIQQEDRKTTRQLLHQMSPQLQFFGVMQVIPSIKRLEKEYEIIPIEELKTIVQEILSILEEACEEVSGILKTNFE